MSSTPTEEEVQFLGTNESESSLQEKKRRRESGQMPNTTRSPSKRTRKNSIGAATAGAPPPADNSSSAPPPSMDQASMNFLMAMEARMMGKMDSIAEKVADNSDQIKEMKQDQAAMKIDVNKRFEKQRKETKAEIERALVGAAGRPLLPGQRRLTIQQEETYDLHRRALRLWPIKGPNYPASLRNFFVDKLKLPTDLIAEMGNVDFRRCIEPRQTAAQQANQGQPKDEVIVTFKTRDMRDRVKSAGANLAGQAAAGIRIHVPGFLLDDFHTLQSVGYHMKKKDENVRRSIKFDDQTFSLVMDVKIGENWKRITAEEAKEAAKNNPDIKAGPDTMKSGDIAAFLSK